MWGRVWCRCGWSGGKTTGHIEWTERQEETNWGVSQATVRYGCPPFKHRRTPPRPLCTHLCRHTRISYNTHTCVVLSTYLGATSTVVGWAPTRRPGRGRVSSASDAC